MPDQSNAIGKPRRQKPKVPKPRAIRTPISQNFIVDHIAEGDPHTGYQKESEKGQIDGYASLDGSGDVPNGQIADAIARDEEMTPLFLLVMM